MQNDFKGAEKRRFETREKLMRISQALFSKKGYHNTQVTDIVKAANVSAGTFYNYFTDKKDIFAQLVEDNLDKIQEETKRFRSLPQDILQMPEEKRQELFYDITYKVYDNIFKYMDNYPQQMLMTIRGIFGVDKDIDQKAMDFYDAMAQDFIEDLELWQKTFKVETRLNKVVLAHIILGSLFHVSHIYLTQKSFSRKEAVETIVESTLGIFGTNFQEYPSNLDTGQTTGLKANLIE
jgi:AcrR family transcriptional regulator